MLTSHGSTETGCPLVASTITLGKPYAARSLARAWSNTANLDASLVRIRQVNTQESAGLPRTSVEDAGLAMRLVKVINRTLARHRGPFSSNVHNSKADMTKKVPL